MIKYPETRKEDIVENYHGINVSDPYRWLEDPESEESKNWTDSQNKITREFINSYPKKDVIRERLTKLWNYPKYSVPSKEGSRYFFSKNDGLQNQSVLYMKETLDSEAIEVLDPNKLSEDGTVALTDAKFSKDGKYMAYSTSRNGSDQQEIRIRNIETGKDFDEVIKWCKFAGIAWKLDDSGFFYNRFPDPSTVASEDTTNYNRVYWHTLGTSQNEDILIYKDDENKELGFIPFITDDGKYLILYVYHGTATENRVYYREVESNGDFVKLFDKEDSYYNPVEIINGIMYLKTELNAPKGRIIAVDLKKPDIENWKEIISEQDDVMDSVEMVNDKLIVSYMHNAYHRLKIYALEGNLINEIDFPAHGSIEGFSGKVHDKEMFLKFDSFVYPPTIMRYDFESNKLENFHKSEIHFDFSEYETKQVFYPSKDGTKVPMFLTYKKGLELNGDNPVILYGYGGFNVSLTPAFSIARVFWIENGGIFALANLRGGGELGEEWHKAGMLENKQNVFDDFISAGEWLIENKYTNSSKLAIQGGSNGGLLTGACMTQRPDLFGAVICSVPVIDMLRYHKFTVGHYWICEYGNAEANPEHFKFMYAYSPLHNVKEDTEYPPTLITTADTDDRVVPAHAKKFAATLQYHHKGENPVLIRVETKAGHGAGKPTTKVIEEQTDIYSFLFKIFGMNI